MYEISMDNFKIHNFRTIQYEEKKLKIYFLFKYYKDIYETVKDLNIFAA